MLRKIFQYAIAQPMNKVDKINTNRTTDKTTDGLLSLSGTLLPFAQKLLGNKGFIEVDILTQWEKIVGTELARYSFPQKIDFKKGQKNNGILYLGVPAGAFALEIQHKSKYIIDKINTYFGYNAVSEIRIIQNSSLLPQEASSPKPKPQTNLSPEEKNYISELANGINNPNLKNILIKLGQNVFNDKKTNKQEQK